MENGQIWRDTDGNILHAHGGHILRADGYWYWYGEDRTGGNYVSVYRSRNLHSWEFRNHVLTVDSPAAYARVRCADLRLCREIGEEEYRHRTGAERAVNTAFERDGKKYAKVNIERPKVLFCPQTGRYVLWAHYENGADYSAAAAMVASCDTPDGDFVYHGSFNPYGEMSRDCTLFADDDGRAYFISASRENCDLHFYRLTPDFLNVARWVSTAFQGESREAPAVFKRAGRYYILSSYCTGWAPNQGQWACADSIDGDWSVPHNFGDETTYRSQPAFVVERDGAFFYVGDRWMGGGAAYFDSTYVVLPIDFDASGEPSIAYSDTAAW